MVCESADVVLLMLAENLSLALKELKSIVGFLEAMAIGAERAMADGVDMAYIEAR